MPTYGSVTPDFLAQLEAIAPGRVTAGEEVNPDYGRDEMPIYGVHLPEAAVEVLSTEEIAAVVKLCYEHNIPVTTRGAGTGLVGGCVPAYGGVLLVTTRMNRILSYDLENFTVTVQPGVLLQQLAEDALSHGCLYPPDPGEKLATLGGNVSTNASGMRGVKYGATRDYVRAMTVVLPTGEVTTFGSAVSKTSSGYNLLQLLIGSEGTLGVITELTLKLLPAPAAVVSLVVPFGDLAACISTVPKLRQGGLNPQAIEFFEKEILRTSEAYLEKQVFPREIAGEEVGAYLLITFDGESEAALEPVLEKAADLLLDQGALDVLVADTPAKLKEAWAARSSFLEGIEEQTKLLDECDVVVPVTRIPEYVLFAHQLAGQYDFRLQYFGHAGDGNLHIYTCSNDMDREEFLRQVDAFMTQLYAKTMALGGQISGEHGIGRGKVKYLAQAVGETNLALMRGIKQVFDPKGILNPGKVFSAE